MFDESIIRDVMSKASDFLSYEVKIAYTIIAAVNEWQKETGGTLDELLSWMEKEYGEENTDTGGVNGKSV